jgi:hypothetical protein
MTTPADPRPLAERYFHKLLEAAFPLMGGPDPEVAVEALIEAAGMLKEHLERELQELRQEQAE